MFVRELRLRNFRNFSDTTVRFPPEGAAVIGANGHGKTNLLEAIYYLEIFRSFRGAPDAQLVAFDADYFRVEGRLEDAGGEDVVVGAAYAHDDRRKKVTVNGHEPDRLSDAIGRVGAVVFTGSDLEIVRGSPGARRRFLDILLSLVEPGYLSNLQRYRQTVAQRNELLRDGAGRDGLAAWDEGLVAHGSRVLEARARWITSRASTFAECYAALSGGDRVSMGYEPSVRTPDGDGPPPREAWAAAFRESVGRTAERERRRGVTVVGPHRDDVTFRVEGGTESIDLRSYGSTGQHRTAALALRLAEAETLREARGRPPVLMLDDVFAELDPSRSERVLELTRADRWGQVLVTSPKPDEYSRLGGRLREYRVESGEIRLV